MISYLGLLNHHKIQGCGCDKCGDLKNVVDLTMYIPEEGYVHRVDPERIWPTVVAYRGWDYIAPSDLHLHYKEYCKYPHKCEKCHGDMSLQPLYPYKPNPKGKGVEEIIKQIRSESSIRFKCPHCDKELDIHGFEYWD